MILRCCLTYIMYKYFVISLILIKTGISSFGNAALRLFIKQLSGVLVDLIIACNYFLYCYIFYASTGTKNVKLNIL